MLNREKQVVVDIDREKCTRCGLCISICPGEYLTSKNSLIEPKADSVFGCLQCGHCMTACPHGSIEIRGESISASDLFVLNEDLPGYDQLTSLLEKRRSTRRFKKQEVSNEILDKVIEAASTAPVSIPPSEVSVLVINGFDEVQKFADDLVNQMDKSLKILNSFIPGLFRPFIGKARYRLFSEFIIPLLKLTSDYRKKGVDVLFYNAPAVMLFYGTELTDREDALIAATYATLAAESLGLGTCIIGSVPPVLGNSKNLMEKYRLSRSDKPGMAFVLGYPDIKFDKGIKRRFKSVNYYNS